MASCWREPSARASIRTKLVAGIDLHVDQPKPDEASAAAVNAAGSRSDYMIEGKLIVSTTSN